MIANLLFTRLYIDLSLISTLIHQIPENENEI